MHYKYETSNQDILLILYDTKECIPGFSALVTLTIYEAVDTMKTPLLTHVTLEDLLRASLSVGGH